MWNKTSVKPEGEAILDVYNPKNATSHAVKFMVVNDSLVFWVSKRYKI